MPDPAGGAAYVPNPASDMIEGSRDGYFTRPVQVAFTPDGLHIAVADRSNIRVQLILIADGSFVRKMEITKPNRDYVSGVAVDRAGNIVILTDEYLWLFDITGRVIHDRLGGKEMCPSGGRYCALAMDPVHGRLAVAKTGGKVQVSHHD